MNASDIVRLLNSNHYAPADLEAVDKLCRDFPEFTTAHLLKVRLLEAMGHDKQQELKVAAVYSMNRQKLLQLVTEVEPVSEPEPETEEEETEIIQFSEESSEDADVIIEQHAPYAGPEAGTDLLELDEEPDEELLEIMDEESGEQPDESSAEVPPTEESSAEVPPTEETPAEEPQPEITMDEPYDKTEDTVDEMAGASEAAAAAAQAEMEEGGSQVDLTSSSDVTSEDNTSEDGLLSSLEKNETEMEEPETMVEEVPAIDQVDEAQEKSNNQLISSFINEDPGPIRADKETNLKGDVSLASIREHDGFITDTLAKIYVKQGLFAKAIYAYEKLSLKYPEKSAYFAAQIEKIRNINHS
jgi:hypothetical protein